MSNSTQRLQQAAERNQVGLCAMKACGQPHTPGLTLMGLKLCSQHQAQMRQDTRMPPGTPK
jgi:hypothetical protein